MKIRIVMFAVSFCFLMGGEGPSATDLAKLKIANTKVWLRLLKNPDAHLTDWRSVDLKVLAEKVDNLNEEIHKENLDLWILDKSAVEVINQIRLINSRNYVVILDQPEPIRYVRNYFSSKF